MRHTIPALETLTLERPRDGVAVLTLDRPERYNAMTDTMFGELEAVALALDQDDLLRALIVTGAGKGFCAGYDLADADELASLGALGMLDLQERAARALAAIRSIRVPVIAAVNGPAAGGGLALALAADIRFAAPTATFSAAFVKIGLSAGDLGTSWLLPRLVGPAAAAEFCYTGATWDAVRAERTGLVNRAVEAEDLLPTSLETAALICGNSPGGVQLSKRALQANQEVTSYAAACELENRGQALLTRSEDMTEALDALRARRAPQFTGALTVDTLLLEHRDDGVAVLTINRPDRANSQTVTMFEEYGEAAYLLRDSGARALVVRGAGEKAFCAGFDLAEIDVITTMGVREFLAFQELAAGGIGALRALPFPVIAAIHGPAAGGGMSLALAADIRLAAPTAKFACSFVKVGLSVGELGTSWTLPRLVGPGRAAEIAFTGRTVGAEEAERIGLVNRVVDDPVAEAFSVASAIAAHPPGGVRLSKKALQRNQEVASYAAACELENRGQALLATRR